MHPPPGPSMYSVNSHCTSIARHSSVASPLAAAIPRFANGHSLRPSSIRLLVAQTRESRLDGSQHATRAGASEPPRRRLASVDTSDNDSQSRISRHTAETGTRATGQGTAWHGLRQGGIGCCSVSRGPSARGAAARALFVAASHGTDGNANNTLVCQRQCANVPPPPSGLLHLQLLSRLYGTRRPTVAHPPVTPLSALPSHCYSQPASLNCRLRHAL